MPEKVNDPVQTPPPTPIMVAPEKIMLEPEKSHPYVGILAALAIGLVLSLAVNGYLWKRSSSMNQQLSDLRDNTQAQISKLGDATTSLLEQRMRSLDDQIAAAVQDTQSSMNAALKQSRSQVQKAQRQSEELRGRLEDQQKHVSTQLAQLQDATTSAHSKITEVASDVSGVKTDVNGVKAEVSSTQAGLEKTTADLRRAIGDMGVMSGLIATNGKELETLRALGERNYVEFDISKNQASKKLGNIALTLKKSDLKHSRYTVEIVSDDKRVEKKDKTNNEPVQFYIGGSRQPYEIVINQLKKDEVIGYLSSPKVTLARQ